MTKVITTTVLVMIALFIIFQIGKYSISTERVPSLEEFQASSTQKVSVDEFILLKTPKRSLQVIVASTSEAMSLGLGGRTSLPDDVGMLFIFPEPGLYPFWMKDMLFPIDIIWIDSAKRVVGISENVLPESYPETYSPTKPISYVLELNTGKSKLFGIKTGTVLSF